MSEEIRPKISVIIVDLPTTDCTIQDCSVYDKMVKPGDVIFYEKIVLKDKPTILPCFSPAP